ncbi:MAG: hypothetical protein B6U85_00250 [Desulfurococcales archaeon ex4484_42]|nr:MAG: hypothetical protein B6U85_00250 [Desulfurococcales archaeon ex4484_42]
MFRRRWRGRGRPPKPRIVSLNLGDVAYLPFRPPPPTVSSSNAIVLELDELEALRLVYVEKLSQKEAADRMGISRGTLWRLLESGRRKLVKALIEVKPIIITYSSSP